MEPAGAEEPPRHEAHQHAHELVHEVRPLGARPLVELVEVLGGARVLVDRLLEVHELGLAHAAQPTAAEAADRTVQDPGPPHPCAGNARSPREERYATSGGDHGGPAGARSQSTPCP